MVTQQGDSWVVRARFPGAQAVSLLGPFNNWSTIATPMRRRGPDLWEACLSGPQPPRELRYFVWEPGCVGGRLHHHDTIAV